jgi:carnitine-CoA ligase
VIAAFDRCVQAHPDRLALRSGDEAFTYGELQALVYRAANGLHELGVRESSKVALMLPNGPEFVACWFGAGCLGATLVPLNTRLKGDLLAYQLTQAEVDVAVVGVNQQAAFESANPDACKLLIQSGPKAVEPGAGWLRLEDVLNSAPSEAPRGIGPRSDGLAMIMYTSGTTGRAKGVQIGRQAQLRHGFNYSELLGIRAGETAYVYLPLFHVTAMGSTLGSLLTGANVALDHGFSPFVFWERTRHFGAVVFTFVGSVLSTLYHRPRQPNDPDNPVRRAVGAATPSWLWRDFERRFDLQIVETYGQTEMVALWFMPPTEARPLATRVGTVGMPAADRFEAKIVGPDGRELGPGERGEIAIRPFDPRDMMSGYYRDPEATAAALRSDGWYHTGDLGVRDEDGYFSYAGRLKDCIRRRGEMISAYDIERVVNSHPAVLESAAVGVPLELGEEDVKLCVVARPGVELQPRQLWEHCRAELPSFMVPRWIQVRQSLPKTATERVRKPGLVTEGTAGCWTLSADCCSEER